MKRKNRFEQEVAKLCRRFGQIAVKKGFVTPEQVKEAFLEQLDDDLNGREHRLIGTILFEKKNPYLGPGGRGPR